MCKCVYTCVCNNYSENVRAIHSILFMCIFAIIYDINVYILFNNI